MTGRRARRLLREEMERKFYRLGQFLGGYLHEDWTHLYGTPEKAIEEAIADYPIELRKQVRRELHALLSASSEDDELRDVLNWGLGVKVHFKKPEEARAFAEHVEAKLMESIKDHFEDARNDRR
jgi:hypothetical protein